MNASRVLRPRSFVLPVAVVTFLAVFPAAPAMASGGQLDTTFSGDGKQTTDLGGDDFGNAVVVQPDQKILVAGESDGDWWIVRYKSDGTLDPNWGGGDGEVKTDWGETGDAAYAIALQDDGKVVVAGTKKTSNSSGNDYFTVARYTTDGTLDSSFSTDGKKTVKFTGTDEAAFAIAIQDDGKIVVVGEASNGSGSCVGNLVVVRLTTGGALDSTWGGGDGKVTTNFGDCEVAYAVALDPNTQKVVVAGLTGDVNGTTEDFALARYTTSGTLDTTWSSDGKRISKLGGLDYATSVAVLSDSTVVAGGGTRPPSSLDSDFALAKFNEDGSNYSGWGGNQYGHVKTDFGAAEGITGLVVQNSGKIDVAGATLTGVRPNTTGDFALARYTTDGVLDTAFSSDGMKTVNFGTFDEAAGLALDPVTGNIVAAGLTGGSTGPFDFAVARLLVT